MLLSAKRFARVDHEILPPLIMDCLTDGKSCGRVVADAWCEAHGHGPAKSFGRASDITGATPVSTGTPTQIRPDAAVVACGD